MNRADEVVVLGLGVSGLSCAVRLAEAGVRVRALGAEMPLATTSAVAAAVWYPYKAGPEERVAAWAAASLAELARLAEHADTGVAWVDGVELALADAPPPRWHAIAPHGRRAREGELPRGGALGAPSTERRERRSGFAFRAPRIEMELYLPWLLERARALGVRVETARVGALEELAGRARCIVNCTGLGARELAGDRALVPIRGQLVRIESGVVDRFLVDESGGDEFAFVVPRSRDAILGGTAHEGREDLAPVDAESDAIVARCAALVPGVAGARRLDARVGLRPGRHEVRLEAEPLGGGTIVVHDYGHGGAGVTLSWGCADEVRAIVLGALARVGGTR